MARGSYTLVQAYPINDDYRYSSYKTKKSKCQKCKFAFYYFCIALLISIVIVSILLGIFRPELCEEVYAKTKFTRRSLSLQADADKTAAALIWENEDGNLTDSNVLMETLNNTESGLETIFMNSDLDNKTLYEVVLADTIPTTNLPFEENKCREGWEYFDETGFCYKAFKESVNFTVAYWKCRYYDSNLVSIHSEEENNFVSALFPRDGRHWLGWNDGYWLGINLKAGRSQGISLGRNTDGTMLDFTAWAFGEPDNYMKREDCVIIYPKIEAVGHFSIVPFSYWDKWNDVECDKKTLGYVCKMQI